MFAILLSIKILDSGGGTIDRLTEFAMMDWKGLGESVLHGKHRIDF